LLGLLTLAVLAGGGCSVALMQPPPADHQRRDDFFCTPYIGMPVADGVGAAVLLAAATSAGNGDTTGPIPSTAAEQEREPMPTARPGSTLGKGLAVATAVAVFSSVYGFYQAGRCQHAVQLWRIRTAARVQAAAAPPLPWPPTAAPDVWTAPPPGAVPPATVPNPVPIGP
jgi:hypothetical protein